MFLRPFRNPTGKLPEEMQVNEQTDSVDEQDASLKRAEQKKLDKELIALLRDVSTVIWRIRKRLNGDREFEPFEQLKRIERDIESLNDSLSAAKIECKDQTGKKYTQGMALHVTFQPTEGIDQETIIQTTKPTVFFRDELIQRGDVIVAIATSLSNESSISGLDSTDISSKAESSSEDENSTEDSPEK